jgi:acyl-CoA dehydrogenase
MEYIVYGGFSYLSMTTWIVLSIVLVMSLALLRARLWIWTIVSLTVCWASGVPIGAEANLISRNPLMDDQVMLFWAILLMIVAIVNVPLLRRYVMSLGVFKALIVLKILPTISQTEKEAIEAGNVWADAELFSGSIASFSV